MSLPWPDLTTEEWREVLLRDARKKQAKHLGGAGSGNFGHAGRPGEVGGSASGSGGGSGETRAAVRTSTPQFKSWFKDSQVVDEDGDPLRVYHGTTHDIAVFKAAGAEGLNPESDWGAGVYFTSDPDDASENYAGEGPDLTSRLESRAETLIADAESQDEALDHDTAMGRARAELAGKSPSVIPAYLSMQKPVVLGEANGSSSAKETHFTMEYEYEDPDDTDSDIVGEKGSLPAFLSTLREVVQERGDGSTDIVDGLVEHLSGEDYVSASRLVKIWKGSEITIDHPETGQIINSEVFREALQRAGYDGVIDRTVDAKFGSGRKYGKKMQGVNPDTTHFVVFSPTQAKSAIGNKAFDPKNPALTMSYREKLARLDLGGPGSGESEGHPFRGNQWTSGAGSAAVLKGVDPKANAARETERLLGHWEGLTGSRPTPEALKAAEAELRALPLVHGTTVAGAIGAMEEGLISHAAMQADVADLKADRDEMWEEIKEATGATGTEELAYIQAEDFEESGLSYDKATEVVAKIREFLDVDKVLGGTTNEADVKLGLDHFVFMTHGQKHQDYGSVAVIIDNSVVDAPESFATEHDIFVVAPVDRKPGYDVSYAPTGVQAYQNMVVTGDGYYQTAAAKAGSETAVQHRSREQLFEVKAAAVPKDKVLGFVVTDYDEAERLRDKLSTKGITGKVLYVEEGDSDFVRHQLKTIQSTGGWDEEAATEASDSGKTAYILSVQP